MPDETPNTPTPSTATASPQTPTAEAPPTQTGNLSDRITAMAFPGGQPLPATAAKAKDAGAQQPAAPAATATPQNDDEPPADIKSEAGKANWKMLRARGNEFEAKWKAAQTEIENYKKNPPKPAEPQIPADYEELKKNHAELDEKLKLLDIERHPKFQKHFGAKLESALTTAKNIGGETLANLLKLPDSDFKTEQLENVLKSLSPLKQTMLGSLLLDVEKINNERASELNSAKENYAKYISIQEAQQKQQQEYQKQQADRVFTQELEQATKGLPVFQKVEGNDAWNKQVDSAIQNARNIFEGKLPLPDFARASNWAAAAPLLLQDSAAKGKEIETLKAELARLKGVQPKPGAGGDPKEPTVPANMSLADRIVWQAQQGGAVK